MSDSGEERPRSSATDDRIQLVIDATPALIHTALPDGSIDYFNQGWLTFLGLPLEEVRGWRWTRSVHAEDREAFVAKWRQCLATGEPFEAESRVRRADGQYRWLLHRKVPLRDAGGTIVKWYGSSSDIDDRKRAEHKIDEQQCEIRQILDLTPHHLEAQLQATLNVIPAYTWYAAPSGGLTVVNARCADYLGLPQDHPLRFGIETGAAWDSHIPLLHPDDREESRRNWSTRLSTGSAGEESFRVRSAEGEYRWFLSRAEPLRAKDGTLRYWVGVNHEIHERREAEDALRRSEAWLSEAQRLSHTGSWVLDLETSELKHWSPELLRICGFDPDAGIPSTEMVRARIHPGDRAKNVEEAETAIREQTGVTGERRLVLPDGTIRQLQTVVSPVFDAAGRPIEILGTAMDVTERKRAEEALRESEERYRALIEVSPQMVWVARADGSNIFWNQWWYDYTGLTRAESEEFAWVQAVHPEHRDRLVDLWQQALASGGEWNNEAPLRRADGQYRWHLGRGLPIRDADGRIVRWMGIGIDIHDRREAEEALRESEQRYRNIFEKVGVAIVEEDFSKVTTRLDELKARGVRDFRRYLAEHPELARETFASVKVTDANEAAVALFGAASKQEFFDALPRVATREVKAAWVTQLLAVAEDRRSVEEVVLTTIGGDTVHTLVALVLPRESSGYHSVLVTVVDMSERKRAEEALHQAQAALTHTTRITTLGELTASIAHEVNQPLAA